MRNNEQKNDRLSNTGFQGFLQRWFQTPVGQVLFRQERERVEKELARLFGYYLVQIGQVSQQSLLMTSRVKTKVILDDVAAQPLTELTVLADLDFIPIKADSVDVVFMPHALEAVKDPYHLVRQVDSMLIAEGHLVITGFNPYGCSILRSRLGRVRQSLKDAHLIKMHRVIDWLNLLGYDIKVAQHGPISCFGKRRGRWDAWFWKGVEKVERWLDRIGLHLGNIYIVVAKKRVITPKPVGLDWKLANWLPVKKGQVATSCDQHSKRDKSLQLKKEKVCK